MTGRRALAPFLLMLVLLMHPVAAQTLSQSLAAAPPAPDVRVLIDISGSMKRNDPANLRRPAVELLVKLLPEDGRAGIWLFGDEARHLIEHGLVDEGWRNRVLNSLDSIGSTDMFTDIGAALEAAVEAPAGDRRTSILLLTDGVVDISKNPAVNGREWQRIVNELLPGLQAAGIQVHTVALSRNTDLDLLRQLSLGTGGLAAVAESAEDLMAVFLRIFDTAAPAERVSLDGEGFVIDPSIDEFTALVFRSRGSEPVRLQPPAGAAFGQDNAPAGASWYHTGHYDLITVSQPQAGQWRLLTESLPQSRVTVVSNLSLRLRSLPVNVYRGQSLSASFGLRENDELLQRSDFLSLMRFNLELQHAAPGEPFTTVWESEVENGTPPASGIYSQQLPRFGDTGDYRLILRVDGRSFQREVSHGFAVRTPFAAEIAATDEGHRLFLRSNSAAIEPERTQVVASLYDPDGRRVLRPMTLNDHQIWELPLRPRAVGYYDVKITVGGADRDGTQFNYELSDLRFYYAPERGLVLEGSNDLVEVPEKAPGTPSAEEPVTSAIAVEPAESPAESVPEPQPEGEVAEEALLSPGETTGRNWALYLSLGLGNLLLLVLGIWGYRRMVADQADGDKVLESFSPGGLGAPAAPAEPQETASGEDVGEPEMEGIPDGEAQSRPAEPTGEDGGLEEALAHILGESDEGFGLGEDEDGTRGR